MDDFLTQLRTDTKHFSGIAEKRAFLLSFKETEHDPIHRVVGLDYRSELVLDMAHRILADQQFDTGKGPDYRSKVIHGTLRRAYLPTDDFLNEFANMGLEPLKLGFSVTASVIDGGASACQTGLRVALSHYFPTWRDRFIAELQRRLADAPEHRFDPAEPPPTQPAQTVPARPAQTAPVAVSGPPILGPGEELSGSVKGYFRDYSGFAAESELADLRTGALPLGRYSFQNGDRSVTGAPLFLSKYRTDAPMLHNGVLICAPQGSGKTELILRWAIAANQLGYGVFIIDMKGNMRQKLHGRLRGQVRYFTTDPSVEDCDRINFIAGLHGTTPLDSMRVRQVAEALLPREGWEQGEQAYFYQNHVNWLSGMLHLLLLYAQVKPEEFSGGVTLGDVYEIAADEPALLRLLGNLQTLERYRQLPPPGPRYWQREIAMLLAPADGGQRSREWEYRSLTQSVVNALRPFSSFGTLYRKTGGRGDDDCELGPLFSLADLEYSGTDGPVTIILAARVQDLDDARTVTSLAVKRLQQVLFERMAANRPGDSPLHPVLLLLDETRRIPGFEANEYVTFAREAQAGCVVSYQSLDQIGEPPEISEMLENVGTQIYLGSLVGATAKYFIDMLPVRHRRRYSWSSSIGSDYSEATDVGLEEVPYVTSNELYNLPAGAWPALVYINDQPRRKPFLVDMDDSVVGPPR